MRFIEEMKRRNVFRVGVAYVISAWVLLQFADLVLGNIDAPGWVMKVFMLALAMGFPLALFFAWAFEMTPEGIKREKDVDRTQSITTQTGRKLDRSIIVILLIALAWFAWDKFGTEPPAVKPAASDTIQPSKVEDIPQSIAVLPFEDLSQLQDQAWFADGISEEILNVLASIPDLKVAARTSAFAFKGSPVGIAEIAKTLGVNHVLEGSVRKAGNKVRVTAQLIKADDGFHIWSANYDRELTDIFAIQDEIANSIADELKVSLKLENQAAGNLTGTGNIEAYEHYLRGMSLWHLRTADSLTQAIEEFNRAISLDPRFAKAYAGLALTYVVIEGYVLLDNASTREKAEAAANAALSLDPDNVEALVALAQLSGAKYRYDEGGKLFQKVISLNPSFATAHQWYGNMLGVMGNPQAGLVELQKAWSLDPRSRIIGNNLALMLSHLGRHEEAVGVLKQVLEFAPDFPDGLELLMHIEINAGNCDTIASYGNRLAALLHKVTNTTQVYVDLCQGSDTATRHNAIEEILSWPVLNFPEPDNPSLSFQVELVTTLIELREFDAALTLLAKNMDWDGGYALALLPARQSDNSVAFYCDPRVQALYVKYGVPVLEGVHDCN